MTIPRETWTELQRAETLLIHASLARFPERRQTLFNGFDVDGFSRALLIRAGCGFPPDSLRPAVYLVKYPFSDIDTIRAEFEELARLELVIRQGGDGFALTEQGLLILRTYIARVGEIVSDLDLEDFTAEDVAELMAFDRQIVASLESSDRPHGSPILSNRLRGVRPDYARPALWHHWQRVLTILAASEDEEEHVRMQRRIDPMVWFVRRQLWFADRRPWRARALTLDGLVARATGYAPVVDAEGACTEALAWLTERDQVVEVDGELRLTASGLAACDEDESKIDRNLLSRWPDWEASDAARLQELLTRVNRMCVKIMEAHREGRGR